MEILVISHKYPPSIGGMQKHCFELVEGLDKRHTIHRLIQTAGVSKVSFFASAVTKAKKILKEHPEIEMIYVNDGLMAFVLTKLLRGLQVPIVATIHGLDVVFPMPFFQKWVKKNLVKFDGVIAVSEATRQACVDRGVSLEKAFMVPNGVEPPQGKALETDPIKQKLKDDFGIDVTDKKIIVSIGRGVKRKGFSWFIKNVFPNLREDTVYLIIGPKTETKPIKRLRKWLPKSLYKSLVLFAGMAEDEVEINENIAALNLGNRVKRISGLSNQEVTALIQLADLSVMPNISVEGDFEGFGLVALEAAANGTICVAAAIEGITTAISDDVNGILLPSGEVDVWINKLSELLQNDELRASLSKKYQTKTIEHSFSWDQMVDGYETVFKQIIEQAKS